MGTSPRGPSIHEIVQGRAGRDPAFVGALLGEAVELILEGEVAAARTIIRDVIKGSMGYAELSRRTGTPEKSLVRMFGPSGNPTVANVSSVLRELQRHGRVRLRVRAVRSGRREAVRREHLEHDARCSTSHTNQVAPLAAPAVLAPAEGSLAATRLLCCTRPS